MSGYAASPSKFLTSCNFEASHRPRPDDPVLLRSLSSPVLLRGDSLNAYRDPAAIYHDGTFYLFFTHVAIENGTPFLSIAMRKSRDLIEWSPTIQLTPQDVRLNFSSPGSIVRDGSQWVMCLQSYPRPTGNKYANDDARLYTMRSADLENWTQPTLLRVKGPNVPVEEMGRMIDPCIFPDRTESGRWWCVYKQHGLSFSRSMDLMSWEYVHSMRGGENPCVVLEDDSYVMLESPDNGLELRYSPDLTTWTKGTKITLGQREWNWARGRLTAGFLLDLRSDPSVRRAILFFHGSNFDEDDPRGGFDNYTSVGCAWSDDLVDWRWPVS